MKKSLLAIIIMILAIKTISTAELDFPDYGVLNQQPLINEIIAKSEIVSTTNDKVNYAQTVLTYLNHRISELEKLIKKGTDVDLLKDYAQQEKLEEKFDPTKPSDMILLDYKPDLKPTNPLASDESDYHRVYTFECQTTTKDSIEYTLEINGSTDSEVIAYLTKFNPKTGKNIIYKDILYRKNNISSNSEQIQEGITYSLGNFLETIEPDNQAYKDVLQQFLGQIEVVEIISTNKPEQKVNEIKEAQGKLKTLKIKQETRLYKIKTE